eukprot:1907041-Amphidinium_carterae.1
MLLVYQTSTWEIPELLALSDSHTQGQACHHRICRHQNIACERRDHCSFGGLLARGPTVTGSLDPVGGTHAYKNSALRPHKKKRRGNIGCFPGDSASRSAAVL